MRSALPLLAASAALVLATGAYAGSHSSATSGAGGTSSSATTSDQGSSATTESTPSGASAATGAGANTSATAGGFHVGETVVDSTGATIGTITSLDSTNGQQMAVIKMGDQKFQVPADRLGSSNGNASINMTKAQLSDMIKGASSGAAGGASGGASGSATPPGSAPSSGAGGGASSPGGGT